MVQIYIQKFFNFVRICSRFYLIEIIVRVVPVCEKKISRLFIDALFVCLFVCFLCMRVLPKISANFLQWTQLNCYEYEIYMNLELDIQSLTRCSRTLFFFFSSFRYGGRYRGSHIPSTFTLPGTTRTSRTTLTLLSNPNMTQRLMRRHPLRRIPLQTPLQKVNKVRILTIVQTRPPISSSRCTTNFPPPTSALTQTETTVRVLNKSTVSWVASTWNKRSRSFTIVQ